MGIAINELNRGPPRARAAWQPRRPIGAQTVCATLPSRHSPCNTGARNQLDNGHKQKMKAEGKDETRGTRLEVHKSG